MYYILCSQPKLYQFTLSKFMLGGVSDYLILVPRKYCYMETILPGATHPAPVWHPLAPRTRINYSSSCWIIEHFLRTIRTVTCLHDTNKPLIHICPYIDIITVHPFSITVDRLWTLINANTLKVILKFYILK